MTPSATQQRREELHLEHAGLAMMRYPELEFCLTKIGVNVNRAKTIALSLDPTRVPIPQHGDVLKLSNNP